MADYRPLPRDDNGALLQNWSTQVGTFTKSVTEAGITITLPIDTKEILIVPPTATTAWHIMGTSGGTGEAYIAVIGPITISLATKAGASVCLAKTASGAGTLTFGILVTR